MSPPAGRRPSGAPPSDPWTLPLLDGAPAVVTGAGSGIGRALALALAARGVRVGLVGRREEELRGTESAIDDPGLAVVLPADITSAGETERLLARIASELGAPEILVHGAGRLSHSPIADTTVEELEKAVAVHLLGPHRLTRALLPGLRRVRGQVVVVNSSAVFDVRPGFVAYTATKAALRAWTDGLRAEENAHGVRVLGVFPGRTATPMQEQVYDIESREYRPEILLQPEDVAAAIVHALELPRTAEVTEVRIRPFLKG